MMDSKPERRLSSTLVKLLFTRHKRKLSNNIREVQVRFKGIYSDSDLIHKALKD